MKTSFREVIDYLVFGLAADRFIPDYFRVIVVVAAIPFLIVRKAFQ